MTDQDLDGGRIGVELGCGVKRSAEVNVGDVQGVPLLGVQFGQKEHALQHLHRRLANCRESKRSAPKLIQGEELRDCSLGRKLLDSREQLVPRLADAEHAQRQVVLFVRSNKSFQSVGGAAKLDEVREAVQHERDVAVEQQVVDLVVAAEVLGGLAIEPLPNTLIANQRDHHPRIATDHKLDDLRVVLELDRPVQDALAVGVRDAQNTWSRQGLDQRRSPLVAEGGDERLEVLLVGVHCPAGAASVSVRSGECEREEWRGLARRAARASVRSGEGEREEWRCLRVARLKVCSVAERGAGGGRTSPRWSARGEGDGGQLACGWRGLAALA